MGTLIMGLEPLEEETPRACYTPVPPQLSAMCGREGSRLQGRKRALTRSCISQHLDLGLLSLQSCEKTNFCCSSHPVYGILLWKPELTNVGCLGYSDKNSKWLPQ